MGWKLSSRVGYAVVLLRYEIETLVRYMCMTSCTAVTTGSQHVPLFWWKICAEAMAEVLYKLKSPISILLTPIVSDLSCNRPSLLLRLFLPLISGKWTDIIFVSKNTIALGHSKFYSFALALALWIPVPFNKGNLINCALVGLSFRAK